MPIATYYQTKLALGSNTTLVFVSGQSKISIEKLFNKIWLKIFRFEQRFSRFLPDSELSRFNRNAGLNIPISQEFKEILTTAKTMAGKTDNLFNPFILPALQRSGYTSSFVDQYKSDDLDNYSTRAIASPDSLIITGEFAQIPANTAIDLGGLGKGYLADEIGSISELKELDGYWLSFGGDVIGNGYDENGEPWKISVQDAKSPEQIIITDYKPEKTNFHIASSGTIVRSFGQPNQHHIIDPITHKPAKTDILLATVEASSTCYADILASCAIILGSKKASRFLRENGVKSFLLQLSDNVNVPKIANGNFELKHNHKTTKKIAGKESTHV